MKIYKKVVLAGLCSLGSFACDGNLDNESADISELANRPLQLKGSIANFMQLDAAESCSNLRDSLTKQMQQRLVDSLASQRHWHIQRLARGNLPQPAAESASESAPNAEAPQDFSTTNTQVAGVDEADIVKTNGTHIFTATDDSVAIVASWPAESASKVAEIQLSGKPIGMFLTEDSKLIIAYYPLRDDDTSVSNLTTSYRFTADAAVETGYWSQHDYGQIKLANYDVSNPSAPYLVFEHRYGGTYQDMRRIGDHLHLVQQGYTQYPEGIQSYIDTYQGNDQPMSLKKFDELAAATLAENMRILDETSLDQYFGSFSQANDIFLGAESDCQNIYAALQSDDSSLTKVTSLNLTDATVEQGGYLGGSHLIYANQDNLLITAYSYRQWDESNVWERRTFIHRFELGAGLNYSSSIDVGGYLNDNFSMDILGDSLRLALTQDVPPAASDRKDDGWWWNRDTVNRVVTIGLAESSMTKLGETPALARGERIYSARFNGDKAFIVTFRQVDPLFTIDLADPSQPKVIGELKIPGFSSYLHMIDDETLLAVGREGDAEGRISGIKISLFDVSDFANPIERHKYVFQTEGGHQWSEASYNHHAFSYFAARNLLGIPVGGYTADGYMSQLQLFNIDKEAGITARGSIAAIANEPNSDWQGWWNQNQIRRSVFADDYVYAIQQDGLIAAHIDALQTPVAVIRYD